MSSRSDVLRASLAALRFVADDRERAHTEAQRAYLDDPSAATMAKRQECEIARDIALRDIRSKEAEVEAALAVETDPANRSFYDDTARERAAVEKWLREIYPKLGKQIAEGIARLVEVELRSREANRRLPSDAEEFGDLEFRLRRGSSPMGLSLKDTLRIPAFQSGEAYLWPPGAAD